MAQEACSWSTDDPVRAAEQIGIALHPYQDWVAHGDYGFSDPGDIWLLGLHNRYSPQATTWGDVSTYPDNPTLDAVGGPNGRPAAPAMRTVTSWWGLAVREYAIYAPGMRRYSLTRSMTQQALVEFRAYVEQNSGCQCRQYFGLDGTP
jgi:hypothetical protein